MRWLDKFEEWTVMLMLAAMTGLTFVQVVLRYGFNSGFSWALELTTVFFAAMIFVGASYGVRVGAHIGVDALVKLMPPGPRRFISIIVVALCLGYTGIVLYGSITYVMKMKMVGVEMEDMPIPIWMVRSLLPLGFGLIAFRFLQVLWQLVTGQSDSLHLGDEAADAMKLKADDSEGAQA
ncbi:TRAP transporter small permease [Hydrogenophaga sp. 5NK40-0174]|uniref:TRAP transporter small permease n=1 Tax=Hydrogenophaga sp. 5NK40-0174 TaxID=3127649 RepID=UPI00310874A0